MIRYGIAGIPLTSKGRSFIDSVEEVYKLGLKALEVQLLRVNVQENQGTDYAGMLPKDNENSIIIDVLRPNDDGIYSSIGTGSVIQEEDIVQELFWNMARNYDELKEGGDLADELDVQLSMHAPYYMDMLSDQDIAVKSYNHLKWTLIIGRAMRAKRVVTHTGFYNGSKKDSLERSVKIYRAMSNECKPENGFPYIGVETSGKTEIFGTTAELIQLAKRVKSIEPILNFPHVHSITGGSLIEVSNFEALISEFSKYAKSDLYTEFAGVEYEDHNELKLDAIKHGTLKFETLAEALLNYESDMTIISSSPLLEHDAQYMNIIYLRALSRKFAKKGSGKKTVA